VTRQLDSTGLKRLHRAWRRRPAEPLGLVLDHVQSPYNVGAILRTAAAFNLDHLWLVGDTASPTDAKASKLALGTQRYVEWTWHDTAPAAVAAAREDRHRIVGVELTDDAVPLDRVTVDGPVALVLGHEDRGLSPAALAACDEVGFIPQLGKVGSLNVATAAAIAVYEVRRRSWAANGLGGRGGTGLPSGR
jgi:tRNA (guanosine-2'-O-)-methyltransferase